VAESTARDSETVAMRELARLVREETQLVPAMIPVGAGLLAAVLTD
jgi:predicted O-methyltransferase YrrM